jgi:hypothetical protein
LLTTSNRSLRTVVSPDEVEGKDVARWAVLEQPILPPVEVIRSLIDETAFSEYILLNMFAGTGDWPSNNW